MADRFTPEQYAAAGQYILANFNDPQLIVKRALELGLNSGEILKAVQTVNPNITLGDVQGYFSRAAAAATSTPTTSTPTTSTPTTSTSTSTTSTPTSTPTTSTPTTSTPTTSTPTTSTSTSTSTPTTSTPTTSTPTTSTPTTSTSTTSTPTSTPTTPPTSTPTTPPTATPPPTSTTPPTSTPKDRFTPEQYAAAGQYILANFNDPQLITSRALELGLNSEEILKAVQTVNPNLTLGDVQGYFSRAAAATPTSTPTSTPTTSTPTTSTPTTSTPTTSTSTSTSTPTTSTPTTSTPTTSTPTTSTSTTSTPTSTPTTPPTSTPKDRFTPEQYAAAGQWILKNFNDPKAVADAAKQFGLTNEELLKAAQTVVPTLTLGDITGYLAKATAAPDKTGNFSTTVNPTISKDRTGTGVAVTGDSGLREGYAPYVQRLLERASAEADVPFQKYTGTSPLLESAKQGIANLTTPAQFLQGSNLANAAGIGALQYGQYKPTAFTTGTFANPQEQGNTASSQGVQFFRNYTGHDPTPEQLTGYNTWTKANPNASFSDIVNTMYPMITNVKPAAQGGLMTTANYDAGGSVNVGGTDATNSYTVPANPNIQPVNYGGQNVTNVQASYMSPYMQNVVDTQQQEAKRQAQIANQTIGAKAAQAGAFGGARHGLVESEANRNLQTQLGNIQAQGLQSAYTQGLGQFNIEQQRSLEAQKMAEQSRQFGAELGLKGLQTGIQAGTALGNIGQQQGYLDLATLKQMADLGAADRTFDYNEFLRAEKYPYENLTFMKNMLSGLPISAAATGIDPLSQALTSGVAGLSLTQALEKILNPTTTTTTSDRRLKTDIKVLGMFDDGLKLYSYRYRSGGPMQIGVMADEVAVLRPQAYIKGGAGDGFDAVDYSKL